MSEPTPTDRGPVTLTALRRDLAGEFFSLERGLPHTFTRLWIDAGSITRRYVETRDPALVRPVRYLLIAVAAYSAIAWLFLGWLDLAARLALTAAQAGQLAFVTQNAGWIVLFVVPCLALVLWAFDTARGGAAAMVHAAYTLAQTLWAQCLVLMPLNLLENGWLNLAASLGLVAWMLWTWASHYPGRPWRAWPAALAALVASTAANQGAIWLALRWFGPE